MKNFILSTVLIFLLFDSIPIEAEIIKLKDGKTFEQSATQDVQVNSTVFKEDSINSTDEEAIILIADEFEPYLDEIDEEEFKKNIEKMIVEENFEELERIYQTLSGRRVVFPSGNWGISVFYDALEKPYEKKGIQEGLKYIAVLKRWGMRFPNSLPQLISLADGYKSLGWEYRGTDTSRTITEEGAQKFEENLQKSLLVAEDILKLNPQDPQFYNVMLVTALAAGAPKETLDQIFEASRAIEPLFFPIYENMAMALLPRWKGEPGELESFAQWAADNTEPYGDEIYARIADATRYFVGGDFFAVHEFDWLRIKRGFEILIDKYPKSYFLLHRYCWFASYAQQKDLAYKLFEEIEDHWDNDAREVWFNRDQFLKWQEWAFQKREESSSELQEKILQNDYESVKNLISNGEDIQRASIDGYTPLMTAISHSFSEIALLLLDNGADFTKTIAGYDAITLAAHNGLRKVIEKLLEKGADINSLAPNMFTPLHLAADAGYTKIIKLLLQHPEIDANAKTRRQGTALHFSSAKGHFESVQILLDDKRIDIDAQDEYRETALHYAVRNGHVDVVETLIAHGANINLQGYQNFTPLGVAVLNDHKEIIKILKSHVGKEITKEEFEETFARTKEYNDQGNEYLKKGEFEKARELFQKAIDEGADTPYPYYNLFLIVFNNDRNYQEALTLIEKAITLNSTIPIYFYQRGRVFQKLGQEEDALRSFREYIEIEPNGAAVNEIKAEFPNL